MQKGRDTSPQAPAPITIDPENYREAEGFGIRHERSGAQMRQTSFGAVVTDEYGAVIGVCRKIGITRFDTQEGTGKRTPIQGPIGEYPTREDLLTVPGFIDRWVYPLEGDEPPAPDAEIQEADLADDVTLAGPKDPVLTAPVTTVPGVAGNSQQVAAPAETEPAEVPAGASFDDLLQDTNVEGKVSDPAPDLTEPEEEPQSDLIGGPGIPEA